MRGTRALERPIAARYAGRFMIAGAAVLLLAGALRMQGNMISAGLMFLSLGLISAPDLWNRGWPVRLGILALAGVGVAFALIT